MKIAGACLNYASCSQSKWQKLEFDRCFFHNAYLTEIKAQEIAFSQCEFRNTTFFKTPLRDLDFSDSTVHNLILSDDLHELKGAIFSPLQGAELSQLMGIILKD